MQQVRKCLLVRARSYKASPLQVYADGKMPSTSSNDSKVSIARSLTGGKIGGATSFVRIMPCKTGFPEHGYPGWSDRELVREGTAILRESPGKQIGFGDGEQSSQAIFGHDERPSRDASSVMRDESTFGGNSWQSHDARRSVMRDKVTWSDDVRDSRPPQGTGKSIHLLAASQISETPSGFNSDGNALSRMRTGEGTYTPARKLMVELHGAGGGVYPRQGGPNLHKASLESWRMPHTQVHLYP